MLMRDGKRAVQHATKACEITNWKNSDCITERTTDMRSSISLQLLELVTTLVEESDQTVRA